MRLCEECKQDNLRKITIKSEEFAYCCECTLLYTLDGVLISGLNAYFEEIGLSEEEQDIYSELGDYLE
ncbi:hypothetical protein [uncultured Ilyobacter sp.]|uniref:hypothetical protein n=1 Tax=uncultured Ilyobacter sp. TaxID=544433 RepID=UPI0029C653CF|nr:hypothetical protein [uncultured Ilyobacter sp.]